MIVGGAAAAPRIVAVYRVSFSEIKPAAHWTLILWMK